MNFQFKTSSCHHHGTIKPVKPNTGKHTGKWICSINGPSVTAQGMVAETIYTAPYIGAAKAAIAKFLQITVSQLETVQSSSQGGTQILSERQREQTTPQRNVRMGELKFDDNDDEFANFDLRAAVSSAKKQSPPPQQKIVSSPHKRQQKMNPYKMQQYNTPNHYGATGGNSTPSATFKADRSTKPPQNPKHLKSPNLNLSQLKSNTYNANASSSKQEDQKKIDGMRTEAEELRLEKDHLQKEIIMVKKQEEKLEEEARIVWEENERLKRESKSSKQQQEKLKGQTRDVREEHEKVKSNLKIAKQQQETSEKDARIAREEKEQCEKEAKAAKESLDSRRSELDCLMKQNPAEGKSAEESNSNNSYEPSKKKRKAGKQAKSGTVSKSLKVVDLKEEAVARGDDVKVVSKMKKSDLLNSLVVGSTCITETDAWGEILRLRAKFENDILRLREKYKNDRREAEKEENKRLHELHMKQEQEERERQEKMTVIREKERASEKTAQVDKHTHHFPTVHRCKLAKAKDLIFHGSPRYYHCSESECSFGIAFYTCEKCDFDICHECFRKKTMTPKEKKAEAKKKAALDKQRREEEAEMRRLQEEEEKERHKQWDPKAQFKPKIIYPPGKNTDPDGNKKRGFTVWCSDGFDYDGFHSYEGAPDKEFDSTYGTKDEANERARYLFLWKNPWGHGPEMIMEEEEVDKSMKDGLVTYCVSPPDSSTWTVAVVPDAAYAYMENATLRRHGQDIDHHYTAASVYGYGL